MSEFLIIPTADGDTLAHAVLAAAAPVAGSADVRVYRLAPGAKFIASGSGASAPDSVPAAFADTDWTLEPGASADRAVVTIAGLPLGTADLTGLQYSADGGAGWTDLGAILPGAYVIPLAEGQDELAIRAVNPTGAGAPSALRKVAGEGAETATVGVVAGKRSYALTLPAGVSTLAVNGVSYKVDPATVIGKPPVILADVGVSGNVAALQPGGSVVYGAAPYLYDPAGGLPEVVLSTLRNGVTVGAGDSYAATALDLAIGFGGRQQVINAYGAGERLTRLREPELYAPAPLRFTGSQRLYGEGLIPGTVGNVVIAMTFVLPERMVPGPMAWITDANGRDTLYVETRSNGGLLFGVSSTANTLVFEAGDLTALAPADTLSGTQKLTILATVGTSRASRVVLRDGVPLRSVTKTAGAPYTMRMDKAVYVGGSKWNAFGTLDLYDMRIWSGVSALADYDVMQSDVQALFISSDGALRDPALANDVFGMPALWVPIDSDKANALGNLGSGGNFMNKTGVLA